MLLVSMLTAVPAVVDAQKLLFVVRHAERADAGGEAQTDPGLSPAGEARAAKLAALLADTGITAIYATEYRRTQDTAKPLAAKLGVPVQSMGAREQEALVQKLKSAHSNDAVLLIGHSNTVPALVKAFGGPEFKMGEDEYDSLFIVVPATGATTRIRY